MSTLIEENDVSIVNLSVALEFAVIEHRLENDHRIYVNEFGCFPLWIKVIEGPSLISLRSHTFFRKNTTILERLELCNRFNGSEYWVTAALREDVMLFDHAISFKDGILKENVIRTIRKFSEGIASGFQQFDPQNRLTLSPGQSEEESVEND